MLETGIVRRVDELGRVVIPKEIRKTLRIKEGEPLEIYTEKEQLVLKKYSPIESILGYAECVCDSLREITEKTVMICDTDKIIFVSGKNKEMQGKEVSFDTEKIMSERKSVMRARIEGSEIPSAYKGEETDCVQSRIIVPIVSGGDVFGGVILSDKNKGEKVNTQDVKLVQLSALMLAKRFE